MTAPAAVGTRAHAPLPGTDWALWRPLVLRAPGFPAGGIDRLASPALARAVDDGDPDYPELFRAERNRLGDEVLALAGDPRLQLALAWQNHRVFDTAIAPLLRRAAAGTVRRTSKHRGHEQLIANYWHRYCVKNDTIGFFGPAGWALLDPDRPDTLLRPGPGLVAADEVFFESWAVDRLAESIAADPRLRSWLAPRRIPFVDRDGRRRMGAGTPPSALSPDERAVLRACTGRVPARELADRFPGLDVPGVLDRLVRARLVTWTLELPLSPYPERDLRRFLDRLDPELAAEGRAALDRLEAGRAAAARAARAGDPGHFVAALTGLDETFVAATGRAPSRNSGRPYGGRTLLYHDARRDTELVLGADVLAALEPVGMLLDAARWLTYRLGEQVRERARAVAERLGPVDLATFWFECMPIVHRAAPAAVPPLQAELRERWQALLAVPADATRVRLAYADLREPARTAFAAPASGWAAARYVSPDLMLAAADADALHRGDFEIVLGEIHLALASCRHYCFVTQHPDIRQLHDTLRVDWPGPRLLPAQPKESHGRLTIRTQPGLIRDEDFLVALFEHTTAAERPRLLDAADLIVTPGPDWPTVDVPGAGTYPVVDVFAETLTNVVMDAFTLLPPVPHRPRVTIDRLVVQREGWRFAPAELGFARIKDAADRYAAARRWWRSAGLPRHAFVRVPGELKPFHLDAANVFTVEQLAKSVRRLAAEDGDVQVSEMLPGPDQLWLTDAVGGRYTAELRVIAVDQRGPTPA